MTNAPASAPTDTLPPTGFWRTEIDGEVRIGARHRSLRSTGSCIAVLICAVVTYGVIRSCVLNLNAFNIAMVVFMAIVAFFIVRAAALSALGRTEVRIRPDAAEIVEGIGPASRRTPFDPRAVTAITEYVTDERSDARWVQLDMVSPVYFGGLWSNARRRAAIDSLVATFNVPYREPLTPVERERCASKGMAGLAIVPGPSGTRAVDDGQTLRLTARCWTWAVILFAVFGFYWNAAVISSVVQAARDGQYGLILFLTPFVACGLAIVCLVIYILFGKVEVTLRADEGTVFTGVGPIGRTRRFQPSKVTGIREHYEPSRGKGGSTTLIVIEVDEEVHLGGSLATRRREWLRAALAARLLSPRQAG